MNQGTNLGGQIGRWIVLAALVAVLGVLLLTIRPVFAQTAPPNEPTILIANAVGTQTIELSWTEPNSRSPFTGYKIERSTNNGGTWVVAAANTGNDDAHYSDTHSSLAGKTAMYRVSAINAAGTGPVSSRISATPPVSGAQPNAPTGLMTAADGSTTVNLSWTAPARGSSAITGYTVQHSAKGEQPWTTVATSIEADTTTYADTITAAMTRHYRVAATNTDPYALPEQPIVADPGRGPFSASVSATTPPAGVPRQPTGLMANPVGTTMVELEWTGVRDDTYPDTGYRIERSIDNGKTWVVVAANTGNDDAHYSDMHSSLAGKTAMYRVAGINILGTGPVSATTSVTPPVSGAQPNAPTGLRAVATDSTTINLTWTAPARGSSAISEYTVQWSSNGKLPWKDIEQAHSGTETTYTNDSNDTDAVTAGITRHYRVAATNSAGTGPYSRSVSVTTPQTGVPEQPTILIANAVGTQTIELSWTEPNSGSPFTGYKIERSTNNGGTWVVAAANTGNDDAHYSDTHSSLAGRTVMYRVAAINAAGTGQVSDTASATPPVSGAQPNAPTGLMTAADGSTTVNLSWTAPARGSSAITGYTVQHSAKGEQPWTTVATSIEADTTTYADTITAGMTRHYRVAATNTDPYALPEQPIVADPGRGPFSASVSATTPPAGVPRQPTGLMANPVGTTMVELEWTGVRDDTYPDTGYRIERSIDNGKTWVVVAANTGNDDAHYSDMHSSLAGKTVMYRVAGINILGTGPVSATTSVTPPVPGAQPNAPTGLTVVAAGSTTIVLTWTAPARGSSAISGYAVQWSSDGELPWALVETPHAGTATIYTATGNDAGATRHYRVAARNNSVGLGPYSTSATVGPADQPGAVSLSTQQPVAGTRITATLTDADGMMSGQMWQWQKSSDTASWMSATGTGATTRSYTPVAADAGYYLRATVMYTDKNRSGRTAYSTATGAVTLPADRMGTVTLDPESPVVGSVVTASVSDPDGEVTGTTWQWASAETMDGTFTDIDGETSASYTPVDAGMYLMAMATYTDKYRSDRTATSDAVMVTVDDRPQAVRDYDNDGDPGIQIDELFDAIDDYFEEKIDIDKLFEVIDAYFG